MASGSRTRTLAVSAKTKKRSATEIEKDDASTQARPEKRMFPIFSNSPRVADPHESSGSFRWKRHSYLMPTCLYGENLNPEVRTKIAAFDLDGTIIKWSPPKKEPEWEYWHKKIPHFLKEAHDAGNTIVLFSNQLWPEKRLVQWRQKIQYFAGALHDVPFILFAATARDVYRKPMPGMWVFLEKLAQEAGITIDKQNSVFIGDAAGRKGDHSGTDRKFANNLGLKFFTPEEYFLKQPPQVYELKGIHVSKALALEGPRVTPTSSPILPVNSKQPEMVVFVGSPASGKTSFFESVFLPAGYEHVNQDTLGSRSKCLKAVGEFLTGGASCVVDNTNRDKKTRQHYLALAKSLDVSIRCFVFNVSTELAWHNNLYRSFCLPLISGATATEKERKLVPYSVFTSFAKEYEEPTVEEGFKEVKTVNWQFQGDVENERYWRMWLQIDGK